MTRDFVPAGTARSRVPGVSMSDRPTSQASLERRVDELERTIQRLSDEVMTRRLVVVDAAGTPRVVAEVARGTAEVRVTLARDTPGAEVVLHAGAPDLEGAAPAVGLQLRARGEWVAAFEAACTGDGWWSVTRHADGISERPTPRRPPPATGR